MDEQPASRAARLFEAYRIIREAQREQPSKHLPQAIKHLQRAIDYLLHAIEEGGECMIYSDPATGKPKLLDALPSPHLGRSRPQLVPRKEKP